ncbi:hypothetical protein ABIC63_005593 [Pseudacidovorax sp. 1753]|uniref:hypothetical protein n=1 Tax=Pseudacidovorax sp. 1753 TaxID=3156419 RepID=UPI00339AB58D
MFEVTGWRADHARVSLFSSQPWSLDLTRLFEAVWELSPDSTSSRVALQETVLEARSSSGTVRLAKQGQRLDFFALPPMDPTGERPPMIDDGASALARLITAVSRSEAFRTENGIIRVALGANAFWPAADLNEAYRWLNEHISFLTLDPAQHADFELKMNFPCAAQENAGIRINRMGTWTVGIYGLLTVAIGGAAQASASTSFHHIASILGFDVNSDGARAEVYSQNELDMVLRECVSGVDWLLRGI